MAEIPRVPQVVPGSTVSIPVHRVAGGGDKPPPRKDHERPPEDVLELSDQEPEEEQVSPSGSSFTADDEGHFDIAC